MKFSRLYESILILIIVLLFIRLVITSENLISLSQTTEDNISFPEFFEPEQVNLTEPTFGPMQGDCSSNAGHLYEPYHFSRVTTNNYYFVKSDPLVPMGVFSSFLLDEGGNIEINTLNYPSAVFKIQKGLMYIEGEIIN